MQFPETSRRRTFRAILAIFVLSMFYDLAWYFITSNMEEDESGGVEDSIKSFSNKISIVSFVFRIPLILVLHKASLDFLTIVKGKNANDKDAQSLEEKVREIIEDHGGDQQDF